MSKVIHPAYLTAAHIGEIVRWEKGDSIRQGRLEGVHHAAESDWLDATIEGPTSRIETLVDIEGCDRIVVRADDDRAVLTIIQERA